MFNKFFFEEIDFLTSTSKSPYISSLPLLPKTQNLEDKKRKHNSKNDIDYEKNFVHMN